MSFQLYMRPLAHLSTLLLLLGSAIAPVCSFGQESPVEWIGGTSSDWNTGSNWLSGSPPMEDIFGPLNNAYFGVNSATMNTTIDLGGMKTDGLFTIGPAGGGGNGLTAGRFAGLRFGNAGGETEYTIQNGTINLDQAGSGGAVLQTAENLTVNLNASVSGGSFYQLGGGSTLNIGPGVTGGDRFDVFNGGPDGSTVTANVNAVDYAFNRTFGIWLVGAPTPSTVAIQSNPRNTIVNVNANQTSGGGLRTDVAVGWAAPGYSSKLVIRNGATMTTSVAYAGFSGSTEVSEDPEISSSYIQVGDETSQGFLNLLSTSNSLRLGTTIHPNHTSGSEGVLDILNGDVTMNQTSPILLGYGRDFQASYILPGSTGRIVFRENGTLTTRAQFTERDVETDNYGPGRGILEFDGGTLIVDDRIQEDRATDFITAGVEVNIMDGGMVFQISAPSAGVTPGDFNGDTTVNIADYTVWRNNLGADESALFAGTGDNSTIVDTGDYDLWKMHFGETGGGAEILGSATINAPLLGVGTGGLTVQGGGELILNGANTYVGDTIIDGSTLSIAIASLADGADVELLGDATLDLSFGGTDTVDQLLFDGVAQATGTWGAFGSGADFEDARITGSGLLMVTTAASSLASVTAVPEPSTAIGAIALAVSLLGFGVRRPQ